MSKCPCCFTDLPPAEAWMCASGSCAPAKDAPRGVTGPVRTRERPAGGPRLPDAGSMTCESCQGAMVEVCTEPSCRFEFPPGWRETPSTCVVMAGARASGKSMYIAVLVKQLEQFGELAGFRVSHATHASMMLYRTVYERPLFEQRGILAPTGRISSADAYQREPLVLDIAPRSGSRHYLVLRDVGGEDLEAASLDMENLRFMANADGVLFLFDPLSLPDVREQLLGLIPTPATQVSGESTAVLDNILRLIEGRRPRLALVLSKFDTLQAIRDVHGGDLSRIMQNTGAAFAREPALRGRYAEQDGQLLHEEIRSLLQWLGVGWLATAMERLSQQGIEQRFFAVSALGDSPDGAYLHDRGIAPFRCLDPIRWIVTGRAL